MLLTRIRTTCLEFKITTSDGIFSTGNGRIYAAFEAIVIGEEVAIVTRDLM
jgi:hypothetical protein